MTWQHIDDFEVDIYDEATGEWVNVPDKQIPAGVPVRVRPPVSRTVRAIDWVHAQPWFQQQQIPTRPCCRCGLVGVVDQVCERCGAVV